MPLKKASGAVVEQTSAYDPDVKEPSSVETQTEQEARTTTTMAEDLQATDRQETRTQDEPKDEPKTGRAEPNVDARRHEPPPSGGQVATRNQSTGVATSQGNGLSSRMQELEDAGFEGLELGFGAFPSLVLNSEGLFQLSDQTTVGTEILGTIEATKKKLLIKNTKCDRKDEDFFYVFDINWLNNPGAVDSQGASIHDHIKEWSDRGWGYEVKQYLDVAVSVTKDLVADNGTVMVEAGEMVLLQVPKTSIGRFSGYAARQGLQRLTVEPTRFYVGPKIVNVDYPFYPWAFSKG